MDAVCCPLSYWFHNVPDGSARSLHTMPLFLPCDCPNFRTSWYIFWCTGAPDMRITVLGRIISHVFHNSFAQCAKTDSFYIIYSTITSKNSTFFIPISVPQSCLYKQQSLNISFIACVKKNHVYTFWCFHPSCWAGSVGYTTSYTHTKGT